MQKSNGFLEGWFFSQGRFEDSFQLLNKGLIRKRSVDLYQPTRDKGKPYIINLAVFSL